MARVAMQVAWSQPDSRLRIAGEAKRGRRDIHRLSFTEADDAVVIAHAEDGFGREFTAYTIGRSVAAVRTRRQKLRRDGLLVEQAQGVTP